jgi:hypothetical protein
MRPYQYVKFSPEGCLSPLLIYSALHVLVQMTIKVYKLVGEKYCPVVTMLHFTFRKCKMLVKSLILYSVFFFLPHTS